jgi:hypothetical protein
MQMMLSLVKHLLRTKRTDSITQLIDSPKLVFLDEKAIAKKKVTGKNNPQIRTISTRYFQVDVVAAKLKA